MHRLVQAATPHAAWRTFAAGSLTLQAALLTSCAALLTHISLEAAEKEAQNGHGEAGTPENTREHQNTSNPLWKSAACLGGLLPPPRSTPPARCARSLASPHEGPRTLQVLIPSPHGGTPPYPCGHQEKPGGLPWEASMAIEPDRGWLPATPHTSPGFFPGGVLRPQLLEVLEHRHPLNTITRHRPATSR